jgi:hypothetical protein
MKKNIKRKWIAALVSGEYKQGRNRLKNVEGGYCCLGVLCDLYAKEGKGRWTQPLYEFATSSESSAGSLPQEVVEWSGISGSLGRINDLGTSLAGLNDYGPQDGERNTPLTFEEIAYVIEGML